MTCRVKKVKVIWSNVAPFLINSLSGASYSATKLNRFVCGVLMVLERWVIVSFYYFFSLSLNISVRGRMESRPEEERRREILLMKAF